MSARNLEMWQVGLCNVIKSRTGYCVSVGLKSLMRGEKVNWTPREGSWVKLEAEVEVVAATSRKPQHFPSWERQEDASPEQHLMLWS